MNDMLADFEGKKIRRVYDEQKDIWYFSVVDIIQVLIEQPDFQAARNYWKVLKNRLTKEGSESVTFCNRLKMKAADGKNYLTDAADAETLLRLIQSVHSTKALSCYFITSESVFRGQGINLRYSLCRIIPCYPIDMQTITTERIPIKIWAGEIDPAALQQARNLANLPFAFRWVAVMPDAHVGYGMPIGGVLATEDMIIPNAVGVDIGCGMAAVRTTLTKISTQELQDILALIRLGVPVGFKHHADPQPWDGFNRAPDIRVMQDELFSARHQLGTLGGGNHFIEIQSGDDGFIWLMIHSGSRNFGLKAASEYHRQAKLISGKGKVDLPDPDLAYLRFDSPQGREYYSAMNFCLQFAQANRALMVERCLQAITTVTGGMGTYSVNIHHNYAAVESHFGHEVLAHRKGATAASAGQTGIIPGSMGAHSYITEGLGNEESFQSSSHGAGRRMGRNEATRKLDLVMTQQQDLVKIITRLKPLAVIKG